MPNVLIETQYFPTIAFFAIALQAEGIILDQHENYHKGSYRNRAHILSSQGPLVLSVPLESGKNSQTNIKDVRIEHSDNWQTKHLRSIEACYGKSPYYDYYIHHFRSFFEEGYDRLFELNKAIIDTCMKVLGIEKELILSTEFTSKSNEYIDLKRDLISPKKKEWSRLEPHFCFPSYDQVFSDEVPFAPNLSILDLIFCYGPEARRYLASTIKRR